MDTDFIVLDPDRLMETSPDSRFAPTVDELNNLDFPINPERAGPVLRRLVSTADIRGRIYDRDGLLVVDSRGLYSRGDIVQTELPPPPRGEAILLHSRRGELRFRAGERLLGFEHELFGGSLGGDQLLLPIRIFLRELHRRFGFRHGGIPAARLSSRKSTAPFSTCCPSTPFASAMMPAVAGASRADAGGLPASPSCGSTTPKAVIARRSVARVIFPIRTATSVSIFSSSSARRNGAARRSAARTGTNGLEIFFILKKGGSFRGTQRDLQRRLQCADRLLRLDLSVEAGEARRARFDAASELSSSGTSSPHRSERGAPPPPRRSNPGATSGRRTGGGVASPAAFREMNRPFLK